MSSSPILPFALAKAYTDKKISEIEQGGGTGSGAVDSVNNKTGAVSLDADDILLDDSAQNSKSIAEAINDLNTAVQDVVVVSDSQPSGSGNELWIKPTVSQSIQVPTTEEFTSAIADVSRALNDKYEKPSGGIPASDLADGVIPDVPVQDVQVNGTSVLQNGVANVPIADTTTPGVISIGSGLVMDENTPSKAKVNFASDEVIKTGTSGIQLVPVSRQDVSTFYALAKAAGADMASLSSVTVGQYPEAQKIAIQKMLGIYEAPWELIREDTVTNATEADIEITVDGNGQAFELTDVYIEFISPNQETTFSMGSFGRCDVYYTPSDFATFFFGAYTQQPNANGRVSYGLIQQMNGMNFRTFIKNAETGGLGSPVVTRSNVLGIFGPCDFNKRIYNKLVLRSIIGKAQYRLYGKRKWT